MDIKNDLLTGPKVSQSSTPKTSGPFAFGQPDTIIIHYTAGGSMDSAVRTLCDPNIRASAHMVLGRDGSIVQLAPFTVKTWHAGNSSYNGRSGFNNYSVGIEIDNPGPVTKQGDTYISWFGKKYPQDEVIQATHRNETVPRFWVRYTQEQIETIEEICSLLISKYKIKYILGHDQIAPGRKQDPGPAFPMERIENRLLNANRDLDGEADVVEKTSGIISVDKLNIRSGPDQTADKVALPLSKGTKVTILQESNGWYQVETSIRGWITSQYVQ